jgi:ankyrin repeat protein
MPAQPPLVCRDTPLLLAARRGHAAAVEALLEAGAAADSCNRAGVTPLVAAALFGHEGSVATLLARWAQLRSVVGRHSAGA